MIAGVFGVYGGLSTTLSHRLNHLKKKRSLHLDNEHIAASFKDIQKRLGINIICILGSLFAASGILAALEDWTYAKALYFAVQTVTVSLATPYVDVSSRRMISCHNSHRFFSVFIDGRLR